MKKKQYKKTKILWIGVGKHVEASGHFKICFSRRSTGIADGLEMRDEKKKGKNYSYTFRFSRWVNRAIY